jgi:lipopolysaccharide/colanic/teichoic acid biosynthesis glycosyltransferase
MPRFFDLVVSALGLLVLSPLLLAIALAVRLTSPGPALHRARRAGRNGSAFTLYKFRSMRVDTAGSGLPLTVAADARITPLGRRLRALKLDELPQLINVLAGHMSLVGPRPEDPRYLPQYPERFRALLRLRPGITSAASLAFRDESSMLTSEDPEREYIERILPMKLEVDKRFFDEAGVVRRFWLIVQTVIGSSYQPPGFPRSRE